MEKRINDSLQYIMENWQSIVKKYQTPSTKIAVWQMITTFLPFVGLWILMYFSLSVSYWLTLGLALINAFFLVRIFIIQHDCGHQSFTGSRKMNDIVGFICSGFSLIPYKYWAKAHNFHHGHCGRLETDIRDIGDMPLMTVNEYRTTVWWRRWAYRIFRMPPVLLVAGSIYYVFIHNRFNTIHQRGFEMATKSLIFSNLFMAGIYVSGFLVFGVSTFLKIHLPIVLMFSVMAFFAFYIQHQHEQAYKQWKEEWHFVMAALRGSTYWKLPRVFQWLTGNIGIHHIHHLSSLIPNYNLQRCKDENPVLQEFVTTVSFTGSLKYFFNKLWDEQQQRMITFREYRRLYGSAW
ncbi:MAG: fatty acid desaturase [Saprospiraceae bacterium]|nr:fatty acid desaturase [Saprospiraceae bacterium]